MHGCALHILWLILAFTDGIKNRRMVREGRKDKEREKKQI